MPTGIRSMAAKYMTCAPATPHERHAEHPPPRPQHGPQVAPQLHERDGREDQPADERPQRDGGDRAPPGLEQRLHEGARQPE
ncbi:hypothetical protein MAFF212519_04870 [Clavibacter michiganensis]